ncbi:Protein-tyrosine phosphatase, partial [Cooperia oncophora]
LQLRYRDIPCIDSSRVILKGKQPDYINANWVIAASGQKYICTQGPIPSTVPDFWQMVVQEHCCTIVMLCRLVECKSVRNNVSFNEDKIFFGHLDITLDGEACRTRLYPFGLA